jgi:LysR family cys regulon transcriptional activator
VAAEPIVTYVFVLRVDSKLDDAFIERAIAHVVFTATDTDVIKTYVRLGLGVGIVAAMSYHPGTGRGSRRAGCESYVPPSVTYIACRKGAFMRRFMFDFIELFAPHLTRDVSNARSRARTGRSGRQCSRG